MAGLGILVILLDLATGRKGWLAALAFFGLAVPLALTLLQLLAFGGFTGGHLVGDLVFLNSTSPTDLSSISGLGSSLTPADSILASSLSIDRFGLFFNLLVLAAAALVILASVDYVKGLKRLQGEFYGLMLLSASGMMLLTSATELISIYVSLELTTLPLVALSAFLSNAKSSEAGMKFLIIGAISSAITLYGMALIFGFTGSTGLEEIAFVLQQSGGQPNLPFGSYAVLVGIALLTVGIAFKLSAVPSQMWVPDVYEGAPIPLVAFLSVASKAVAFGLLLRLLYTGFLDVNVEWGIMLAVLAAASMTLGNLVAITQSNIRRLFGYSTIAHAGYILIGVAAVVQSKQTGATEMTEAGAGILTTFGPSSVLFYLASYAAANLTAFFAIMAIGRRIGSDNISDYIGAVRHSTFPALTLALALVALIGVPPTGIFIAKIYIFAAAVNSGLVWLAILGVVNSAVSAYYYLRIVRVMFIQPPMLAESNGVGEETDDTETGLEAVPIPRLNSLALATVALATVLIGVVPGPLLSAAEGAVTALAGVSMR